MICGTVAAVAVVRKLTLAVEVTELNTKTPVVPVAVTGDAVPPTVPVHDAPVGQQATWFAKSALQTSVKGQQAPDWPRFVQGL